MSGAATDAHRGVLEYIYMEFCDFNCEYAEWPEKKALDGAGSCRTFQAVYCTKKGQHVHKNMPCHDKSKRETKGLGKK